MSDDVFKPEPSFVFQPPYAPAHEDGALCVCVHCGGTANANYRVSSYPHRFIPKKWEIEGFSRGLRCWTCSTSARYDFEHYRNYVVWFSPEIGQVTGHMSPEPLEIGTMGSKRAAKSTMYSADPIPAYAEGVRVEETGHSEVPMDARARLLNIRASLDHLFFSLPHVDREVIGNIRKDVYRVFELEAVEDNMDDMFRLCGALRAYAASMLNAIVVDEEEAYSYGADLRAFNSAWGSNFFMCQRNENWLDFFMDSLDSQAKVIEQGSEELRRKATRRLFDAAGEPEAAAVRAARPAFDADGFVQMTRRGEKMTGVKKQAIETAQAVGMGMQLAAANEAGEILVDLASELFSDNQMAQLMLKHPDGRELAKMLMAMLLQTGAEQTNLLPNPEAISHICKLQLTQSTSTLVAPRMKKVRRHLTKLAKLGSTVGATAGAAGPLRARISDDLDDLEDVREQNAVLVEQVKLMRQEMDEIRGGGKKKKERTAG